MNEVQFIWQMKSINWRASIITVLLLAIMSLGTPKRAIASCLPDLDFVGGLPPTQYQLGEVSEIRLTIYSPNGTYGPGDTFHFRIDDDFAGATVHPRGTGTMDASGRMVFVINNPEDLNPGTHLFKIKDDGFLSTFCTAFKYKISGDLTYGNVLLTQQRVIDGVTQTCYGGPRTAGCLEPGVPTTIRVEGLRYGSVPYSGEIKVDIDGPNPEYHVRNPYSQPGVTLPQTYSFPRSGSYSLLVEEIHGGLGRNDNFFKKSFRVQSRCDNLCQTEPPPENVGGYDVNPYKICDQIDKNMLADMYQKCVDCVGEDGEGRSGVWTAIGCVKKDPVDIVQNLIKLGLGMGGGVALIMILASGFMFSVSQGDATKTGQAKEMLTSAIIGLLFIIFSVTILQFIGYSVLRIPGFGG